MRVSIMSWFMSTGFEIEILALNTHSFTHRLCNLGQVAYPLCAFISSSEKLG